MTLASTLCIFLLTATDAPTLDTRAAAAADHRLEVFAGLGYLSSIGSNGGAISAGVRYGFAQNFAVAFDLGYGVMRSTPGVEDRWWLMPALELSVPSGRFRYDLGAGVGLGASSGYSGGAAYLKGPFDPDWAYQLTPAARAYVRATYELGPAWKLFARLDASTLLLGGNSIGSRVGNPSPTQSQQQWVLLWIGAAL